MGPHHRARWSGDRVFIESVYEPIHFSGAFQDGQKDALLSRFISCEFRITHFRLIGRSFAGKEGSEPKFEEEGASRRK
jgi:hypothetical protein